MKQTNNCCLCHPRSKHPVWTFCVSLTHHVFTAVCVAPGKHPLFYNTRNSMILFSFFFLIFFFLHFVVPMGISHLGNLGRFPKESQLQQSRATQTPNQWKCMCFLVSPLWCLWPCHLFTAVCVAPGADLRGAGHHGRARGSPGGHHRGGPGRHRHQPPPVGRMTSRGAARGRCLSPCHPGPSPRRHAADGPARAAWRLSQGDTCTISSWGLCWLAMVRADWLVGYTTQSWLVGLGSLINIRSWLCKCLFVQAV